MFLGLSNSLFSKVSDSTLYLNFPLFEDQAGSTPSMYSTILPLTFLELKVMIGVLDTPPSSAAFSADICTT
jgi:hypothetical protein